jgi:hypothetical protein
VSLCVHDNIYSHCATCKADDARREIDRIMGIVRGDEGWHIFGFGSDGEFHYVCRGGLTLCGRFSYDGDVFQPHIAPRSRCEPCRSVSSQESEIK